MPASSCQQQFCCFGLGVEPESLLSFIFQHELNRFAKILQAFLFRFALSICAGHLKASSPETSLARFAAMNYRRKLLHAGNIT